MPQIVRTYHEKYVTAKTVWKFGRFWKKRKAKHSKSFRITSRYLPCCHCRALMHRGATFLSKSPQFCPSLGKRLGQGNLFPTLASGNTVHNAHIRHQNDTKMAGKRYFNVVFTHVLTLCRYFLCLVLTPSMEFVNYTEVQDTQVWG